MRISSILLNTLNRTSKARNKVDLTSFNGANIQSQNTKSQNKNVSFTGTTQSWSSSFYTGTDGNHYRVSLQDSNASSNLDSGGYYGSESSALYQLVHRHSMMNPDSTYNETATNFTKKRIYFAAPEEAVSEQIKRDHDAIITDNRPLYPVLSEIRESYFNTDSDARDYSKIFRNIGEYYYRLEMADRKELDKLVEDQKQAQSEYDRSLAYKESIDETIRKTPWTSRRVAKDSEVAQYYLDLNAKNLGKNSQKIDYYQSEI